MGHQYAGNPAAFPTDFTVPDDGDPSNATSVNVAFGALGDRTAYLFANLSPKVDVLNAAAGTWTCPANVTTVEILAYGAGGGGGGGCGGDTTTPTVRSSMGGGGGGGSRAVVTRLAVTPGVVYNYVVGAGGSGGAGGTPFAISGNDGADSLFNSVVVGRGAQGGFASSANASNAAAANYIRTPGGRAVRMGAAPGAPTPAFEAVAGVTSAAPPPVEPGCGGQGAPAVNGELANTGGAAAEGYVGGAPGFAGATVTNLGGGAGGGGAAGPGGAGGAGATGGAGSTGTGAAGTATAVAGAVNSGAGGGGGSGGGQGSTAGGAGSAGAAGGSGKISISYNGPQAVFT